jgi:hypothetical protein
MRHYRPLQLKRSLLAALALVMLSLSQVVVPFGSAAGTNSPWPPENNCVTQAVAQINQVRYLGKNSNGDDNVAVEWEVFAVSECVPFGSGHPVPDRVNVPLFGFELRVKIKRRLGNEDTGHVFKREIVSGKTTTFVPIPRGTLETDPVSFTVELKTTAGAVQVFNRVITGLGVPSLVGATQSTNKHSTVPSISNSCFPSLSVTAINFIPGSGATPDNVAINWQGSGPTPDVCKIFPRFTVKVLVRRAAGNVDTVQTVFSPDSTSAQLQLPGAPGGIVGFNVTLTAINGEVVEKVSTRTGNF